MKPRTGIRQRGRKGAIPWQQDALIRRRMQAQEGCMTRGWSRLQVFEAVNAWCLENGQPAIGWPTLDEDRKRLFQLWDDESKDSPARALHLKNLEARKDEALTAFADRHQIGQDTGAAYLNVALRVEVEMAKLDGTYLSRQIEQGGQTLRDLLLSAE